MVRVEDFLVRVRAALDAAGVPYMLTGSLASSVHGVPRATNDIDIIVAGDRAQLIALVRLFERTGLYARQEDAVNALRNESQFNVIDFASGWKIDFIIRKSREFSSVEFERREEMDVEGVRLVVASPEDVLIAKLEWSKLGDSERQLEDAAGIVRLQGDRLDRQYVERWVLHLGIEEQWRDALTRAV